jgi:hypothetical protein
MKKRESHQVLVQDYIYFGGDGYLATHTWPRNLTLGRSALIVSGRYTSQ